MTEKERLILDRLKRGHILTLVENSYLLYAPGEQTVSFTRVSRRIVNDLVFRGFLRRHKQKVELVPGVF
jgi:hypothetical protein